MKMHIIPKHIIDRLGQAPDKVLAEEAGVSLFTIRNRRVELGIPAYWHNGGAGGYMLKTRISDESITRLRAYADQHHYGSISRAVDTLIKTNIGASR